MNFFSPSGQDQFLFENFFRGKRDGVFADASDSGGNNSLFLERFMGWRGLSVDAATGGPAANTARTCQCEQAPVSELAALLEKHSLQHIDYCSIDVQGDVLAVLQDIDFERFDISVLGIRSSDERVVQLMTSQGYDLVTKLQGDIVFKRREIKRLARTSVICAVWHGDADRWQLIAGHAENLAKQTVTVEPVYVFDGRDEPPAGIPGRKVVAHENLSIYQAWNLALAVVATPFVMNLNLDDRLAPDAVELLENTALRENAALVGGEWKICYSQAETDAVEPCFPADRLPFVNAWPPAAGTVTRLGSGTGERGTLGPATLWRMDAHIGAPRYPWRFPDGSIIRVAGDSCWWTLVTQHLKKKAVRITDVIGHYYSHPNAQAEFRGPSNELELMNSLGVNLL